MAHISKYNDTQNLKITYYLGAGASYNSVPIWNIQGKSMLIVGEELVKKSIQSPNESLINGDFSSKEKAVLKTIGEKIKFYGQKAIQFGSIDIYARKLHLSSQDKELLELKKILSFYLESWEKFLHSCLGAHKLANDKCSREFFDKIDKRYLSLLSVLLDDGMSYPKLNKNVKFLTWNYDLQLESAYRSFLYDENIDLSQIDNSFSFMPSNLKKDYDVIHLNGFRGFFEYDGGRYPIASKYTDTFDDYLKIIINNEEQFRSIAGKNASYNNYIRYAWEMEDELFKNAISTMSQTNILIIIGYSFPSFNRKIDAQLIEAFESGEGIKKVIYQDPNANKDLINSLFINPDDITPIRKNLSQFHIPHEFLFPKEPEKPNFGGSRIA